MEQRITDVTELTHVADDVLAELQKRKHKSEASVLALHGDLGAGKTTFMQILGKKLGVTEPVTSPTFVVMKSYALTDQPFKRLVHIDAYRIEDIDEMRPLRFAELLVEEDTILCIEWAERIADLLPPQTLHLSIALEGETRIITLDA